MNERVARMVMLFDKHVKLVAFKKESNFEHFKNKKASEKLWIQKRLGETSDQLVFACSCDAVVSD